MKRQGGVSRRLPRCFLPGCGYDGGCSRSQSHVEIQDARLHYHERTDEFYYVIAGQGTMILDDEEIELHTGVVVYVPRGVKHKAKGNLTVLTVCVPRGVLDDVHEVE